MVFMVSKATFQVGRSYFVELCFEDLLVFTFYRWSFPGKVGQELVDGAVAPVLIGGIDTVCAQLVEFTEELTMF